MIGPVAVGAHPDLEQHRLVDRHRQVARRGERLDAAPGPDEREGQRQLDVGPRRPLAVHEPLPDRRRLRLLHARPQLGADQLHRVGGDLVRDPHARDFLLGLDRAGAREQRRRVHRIRERVEPGLRERRRLADHPVGRLRAERQLQPDLAEARGRGDRQLERARERRARVGARRSPADTARRTSTRCAPRPRRMPRGRSGSARPRAGTRRRRSPSCPRSSSGTGRCRARGRRPRRASASASSARTRSSFASSCGQRTTSAPGRAPARRVPPATRRPGSAARRSARSRPRSRRRASGRATPHPG